MMSARIPYGLPAAICLAVTLLAGSSDCLARTVFVSSSKGDDSASGKDRSCPVRTVRHARELGSDLRLRCGDTFYEYLRGSGFSLSPYTDGSGSGKPVLSGFRIVPAGSLLWERGSFSDDSVWHPDPCGSIYRLDLLAEGFGGYTDNVRENDHKNIHNIGSIYDPSTDIIHGRKCQCISRNAYEALQEPKTVSPYRWLEKDMDFFQPRGEYRYLYVLASDPGLLGGRELWLSMGADGIRGTDFSVCGIKFTGWGKTAVRGGSDITVRDCRFDIIGGSIHEYEPAWIRFGNGVEFWADQAVNDEVSHCLFTRIFDTATTIQGPMSNEKSSVCSNIRFHHNVMRGCRQDFEVWIRSLDGLMPSGCSFSHNRGYDSGDNGFETQEYNNTHLLHYILSPYRITGIDVSDNRFEGGMGLYYANSAMDNMAFGRNVCRCAQGAAVIRGLYGRLEVKAPVLSDGEWVFAEGLSPEGEVFYGRSPSKAKALKRFNAFINALTGGSDFRVELLR